MTPSRRSIFDNDYKSDLKKKRLFLNTQINFQQIRSTKNLETKNFERAIEE